MIDINPSTGFPKMYNFIDNKVLQGGGITVLIVFSLIIIGYYFIFSYLGVGYNSESTVPSQGIKFIEILMWGMFIFLILINGLQYFLNIDLKAGIKNLFSPVPELDFQISNNKKSKDKKGDDEDDDDEDDKDDEDDEKSNKKSSDLYDLKKKSKDNDDIDNINTNNTGREEVFHISDNKYNYEDAKAVCKAHGGKLATYQQLEDSYENGGEWCSFGWSDNQMALYPTQQNTWDKLQKIKGHENDCGRPGVNGGFIKNENVKYGVNCFGPKRKYNEDEKHFMENNSPIPITQEEKDLENKIDNYKRKLSTFMISPFNYGNWSEY